MVKIIWTDSAIEDLNDIAEFIAKDSLKYAQITVKELFFATEILEKYPGAGKIVPEFENDKLRELIRGNYRIVYNIVSNLRIDIITVHNTARLLGDLRSIST